jgi:hypothetical protein
MYASVSPLVSFPQVSPPKPCTRLSPTPYAPHAQPLSLLLLLLFLLLLNQERCDRRGMWCAEKKAQKDLMQKHEGREPIWKYKCVPWNITIYLKKLDEIVWTGFIWLGYRPVVRPSKERNKHSGSVKCWKYLDIRSRSTITYLTNSTTATLTETFNLQAGQMEVTFS